MGDKAKNDPDEHDDREHEDKEPENTNAEDEDVTDRLSSLETEIKSIHVEISAISKAVTSPPQKEGETSVPEHTEQKPESPTVDVKTPTEFRYIRKGRRIVKREVPVQSKKAG